MLLPSTVSRKLPVAIELPLSAATRGDAASLLATVSVPVVTPANVGVKMTRIGHDDPGPRLVPQPPATVNPAVAAKPIAFTVEALLFVSVNERELLLPSDTVPNASDVGVRESCACTAVPVPVRATVSGVVMLLLCTVSVPVTVPVATGAKVRTTGHVE